MPDKKNSFGKDLERALSEGMENRDWSVLNDVLIKGVDNLLDEVGDRMNDAISSKTTATPLSQRKEDFSGQTRTAMAQRQLHAERQRARERMEAERAQRENARRSRRQARSRQPDTTALAFPYQNVGAASSTALTVVGGIGLGVTGMTVLTGGLTALIAGTVSGFGLFASLALLGTFGVLLAKGIHQNKQSALAARYAQVIGKRQYIDIETLALTMNRSEKRVLKELRILLEKGFFPQGHLDRDGRTFMLTDEVFSHYLELEVKGNRPGIIDTTAREGDEPEFPTLSAEDSAELSRMIREGRDHIATIRSLNNDIPGVEISAKLDRLEGLLKEIFERVREHPDQMSRIHELMDYYLPTAVKLVAAYREYDAVSEPGKEIISAKRDIENTLDTINSALKKLLNKLFKDSVLDVTTDAQVLKTVLVQKGLSNEMEESKGENK